MGSREENTYHVSSQQITDRIPGALYLPTFQEISDYVTAHADEGDLVLTMGGGDVYKCARMIAEHPAGAFAPAPAAAVYVQRCAGIGRDTRQLAFPAQFQMDASRNMALAVFLVGAHVQENGLRILSVGSHPFVDIRCTGS